MWGKLPFCQEVVKNVVDKTSNLLQLFTRTPRDVLTCLSVVESTGYPFQEIKV